MSGSLALGATTVAALIGADVLEEVYLQPHRSIGTLIPECAIEERHSDRLQLTAHPVERGSTISDHAFRQPFEVSLRYGWSNAIIGGQIQNLGSRIANLQGQSFQSIVGDDSILSTYDALRKLQTDRKPFSIITGKRNYKNMMLTEIEVSTDVRTESVLIVELHCQEVIIVDTSEATISGSPAQPDQTAEPVNAGQQQLTPAAGGSTIPGLG